MDQLKTRPPAKLPATRSQPRLRRRVVRATDAIFDAVGLRPLGMVVLLASIAALTQLLGLSVASVRAEAVATARVVDHPSRVASFATTVFVKPGDRVEVGTPLVELSPHFIDQELTALDREIEQLVNESRLEQARLMVKEERWLEPGLRQRPTRPSLARPTEDYYAKQLEVLGASRTSLAQDREALTIRSTFEGIVAQITWVGAWIKAGTSVASIMPEFAEEIVAYVPSGTNPDMISNDASAYIVGTKLASCRGAGRVQRRGATVAEAPGQLKRLFRDPVHGMPVHVSIPSDCRLGNGQVVTVDFRLEAI